MHHHQPYARAIHIVQSALSLGCSTHAHRKTSQSLRITWLFVVVRIGPLTKTPYKKKQNKTKKNYLITHPLSRYFKILSKKQKQKKIGSLTDPKLGFSILFACKKDNNRSMHFSSSGPADHVFILLEQYIKQFWTGFSPIRSQNEPQPGGSIWKVHVCSDHNIF